MKTFISDISKKEYPIHDRVLGKSIRPSLMAVIRKDYPEFDAHQALSISELNVYRQKYIAEFLVQEIGELSELEHTVLNALKKRRTLVDKIETEKVLTKGQKIADAVASFGGSWKFIIAFSVFMTLWIFVNAVVFINRSFDPYPFILLNLILSCLAALQAPVIMMSQNRQEEKDRERAKRDYMVNLKAELEIRMLHEKLDHLIMHQQQELIEIQKVQVEMMNDILKKIGTNRQ